MAGKEQKQWTQLDYLARGVIGGASVGVIASLLGVLPMFRGIGLGMLCGCLAGLTFYNRRKRDE